MGEARRRKLAGNTAPKDPKRKYRTITPSKVKKFLVLGKQYVFIPGMFGGMGRRF